MSWISLLASALALLRALTEHLRDRKLIDAALATAVLNGLREADDAIAAAQKARQTVRDDHARNPGNIMLDDEFRRRDP